MTKKSAKLSASKKKLQKKAELLQEKARVLTQRVEADLSESLAPALAPLKQNLADAQPLIEPIRKKMKKNAGEVKAVSLAALTAATGDPEAMKTIVDVLAHGASAGLEKIPTHDKKLSKVKEKALHFVNKGADKIMKGLTWFQKNGAKSNKAVREKYGRKKH